MNSDNMSKFEVKNTKKQKRTKKKCKSEDFINKTSNTVVMSEKVISKVKEVNEQNIMHKKLKETKQKSKSNDSLDDTHNEIVKCNEQESNFTKVKKKHDKDQSDDEQIPPKKRLNITHTNNSLKDVEETDKLDSKTSKQPSKRQLKREKAEKKENEKKMASKMEAMKKGLNYVSKWKHARSEWKFEKLRQIWLIDNLLDQTSIPDDIFPTVLEYFEGCKGMAREQLLKKGMDIIRKIEENEENKNEVESVAYQRARKLLQTLPTEI